MQYVYKIHTERHGAFGSAPAQVDEEKAKYNQQRTMWRNEEKQRWEKDLPAWVETGLLFRNCVYIYVYATTLK